MKRFLIIFLLILLSSCAGAEPNPTGQSQSALLPTLQSTAAAVPPLPDGETPTAEPTAAGERRATATPRYTRTPTPTTVPAEITLTSPELVAVSGRPLRIDGRLQIDPRQRAEAVILAPDGTLLGAAPIVEGEFGTFTVDVPTASWFAGVASATVTIFDGENKLVRQAKAPVQIEPDTGQERYLALYRPGEGETAGVSGTYLFFDGYAQRPAGFRVAITLLNNDCRTRIARQSYAMRGSGYWQGFIVVPEEISGDICALISAGDEGSADRREIQIPIEVAPAGEEAGAAVLIGNPPPDAFVEAGRTLTAYGTAYRAAGGRIQLTLLLGDGTIAATATADVNRYGYWEADMLLPVGLEEEGLLRATTGPLDEPLAVDEILVVIGEE